MFFYVLFVTKPTIISLKDRKSFGGWKKMVWKKWILLPLVEKWCFIWSLFSNFGAFLGFVVVVGSGCLNN